MYQLVPVEESEGTLRYSLIDGLVRLPGIPDAGRNRLWEHAGLGNWSLETGNAIPAPGVEAVHMIAEMAEAGKGQALGASLFDATVLDEIVRAYPRPSLWEGAATNPALADSTKAFMASRKLGENLFTGRDAALDALSRLLDHNDGDAGEVATALAANGCGEAVTDVIADSLTGSSGPNGSAVADSLLERFARPADGPTQRCRAGVLATCPDSVRDAIIDKVAATQFGWIDQYVLPHIVEAIDAGRIDPDSNQAILDVDAVAWAEQLGGTAAALIGEAPAPARPAKPVHPGRRKQQLEMTDALSLIGMGDSARRLSLASSAGLTPEDQRELVAEADVETVMDWAEGSLRHQPAPGEVYGALSGQPGDRLEKLGEEARRRNGDVSPELLCCLPGFANAQMTPAAARRAWGLLSETLTDNEVGWEVTVGLLAHGWDGTVLSLAESAANASLNPA
jgi:hypothetical protein